MFGCVKNFFGRSTFEITFYSRKRPFKKNLTITLTLTIKSNFTLSHQNKNHSLKLTFDIFKPNENHLLKAILSQVKLNIPKFVEND